MIQGRLPVFGGCRRTGLIPAAGKVINFDSTYIFKEEDWKHG